MHCRQVSLLIIAILIGLIAPCRAEVSAQISIGEPARGDGNGQRERRDARDRRDHRDGQDGRRQDWPRRRYRVIGVAPEAPAPYYSSYPYPVYQAPAPAIVTPALTGDYGSDVAALNGKLSRLSAILERQKQKDAIRPEDYDRFKTALDGIDHDERARAYDRGGNLAPEDFDDLYRRLAQVSEDVEVALSQ